MSVQLKITYDGITQGLKSHRLSLAQFGPTLDSLLRALRREVNFTLSGEEHETGRYSSQIVSYVDVQIGSLSPGSIDLDSFVELNPPEELQLDLPSTLNYDDLLERSSVSLLERANRAARGDREPAWVRAYLESIPEGVSTQTYTVMRDGTTIFHMAINAIDLEESEEPLPGVLVSAGRIAGVRFETEHAIYFESEGSTLRCSASAPLVEMALSLRGKDVYALIKEGPTRKVLWLRPAGEPLTQLGPDERLQYIRSRWAGVLEELAK